MRKIRVLAKSLINKALKGDNPATKTLIGLLSNAGLRRAGDAPPEPEQAELSVADTDILEQFRLQCIEAHLKSKGPATDDPRTPLPHQRPPSSMRWSDRTLFLRTKALRRFIRWRRFSRPPTRGDVQGRTDAAEQWRQLLVNLPPRYMKSTVISIALPAFCLGRDPGLQVMVATYATDLATSHHNQFRKVVEADWYRRIFPLFRIDPRNNRADEIRTTLGGGRKAVTVGGSVGMGADLHRRYHQGFGRPLGDRV